MGAIPQGTDRLRVVDFNAMCKIQKNNFVMIFFFFFYKPSITRWTHEIKNKNMLKLGRENNTVRDLQYNI